MVFVFNKIVLLDFFSGITTERVLCNNSIIIDVQDFPESEAIKLFDRGNISKTWEFTATRSHDTEDAAELFVNEHPEKVLGKAPLLVRGTFGGWERFYNEAACKMANCYAEGVRTFTQYELVTGLSSKKKATT
jgi:hypothetical protein